MKLNIELPDRYTVESSTFGLGKDLAQFLETNSVARNALVNPDFAGVHNQNVARMLYQFLKAADYDVMLVTGSGFKAPLQNASKDLKTTAEIKHFVVKARDMILDLCHKRMGDAYESSYNFPMVVFKHYWKTIAPVSPGSPLLVSPPKKKGPTKINPYFDKHAA